MGLRSTGTTFSEHPREASGHWQPEQTLSLQTRGDSCLRTRDLLEAFRWGRTEAGKEVGPSEQNERPLASVTLLNSQGPVAGRGRAGRPRGRRNLGVHGGGLTSHLTPHPAPPGSASRGGRRQRPGPLLRVSRLGGDCRRTAPPSKHAPHPAQVPPIDTEKPQSPATRPPPVLLRGGSTNLSLSEPTSCREGA